MYNLYYLYTSTKEEKIEFRPDEKVDYDETKRLVMEIVDGLSDEQRLAVILFYFEQRSVKEIAEICECSENTVKSRLNYARKKIKEDVLELEKKGTKLYSISVLPFLYWLFREEFMACEVPDATNTVVANSTGRVIEKVAGETVKAGMALGTKIAIGIAVTIISVGGIALGNTLLKNNSLPTEQSSEYDSQQDAESENGTETEQMTAQESEVVTEQTIPQESEAVTELTEEEMDVVLIEDSVIREFLESYEPNDTLEVFELRGAPRTTTYYVEGIGLEYVNFIADRKNILVITIPYSEDGTGDFVYNDLKFYYYDEAIESFVEFTNPPDLEYDEWGSPSCYGYDVYANTDRATNQFSLYNGYVRIGITVNGSALEWKVDGMHIGGSPLEWKSMDGMGESPEIDELIQD